MLCGLLSFSVMSAEWQLEEQQDNVSVFSRETDSGYAEVRAVTQVKSHFIALLVLLDDTDACPTWIAHCQRVETLDWFGATERTVHTFFKAPWPVTNRDMVTHSIATIDEQSRTLTIDVEDRGDRHSTLSYYVRMKGVRGQWRVTPLEGETIEIVYQGYGEAAGSLPRWLANNLLVSSTLETFVNLRKVIQYEKYQRAAAAQITE